MQLPFRRRLHDAAAAVGRAALAEIESFQLFVVLAGSLVLIVVRELFPGLDGTLGVDVDSLAANYRFAIGVAGVVDVARVTSTGGDGAVDHRFLVEGEEEGVMALHSGVVIAPIRLPVADSLTLVLDNSSALSNATRSKHATSMNVRAANDV